VSFLGSYQHPRGMEPGSCATTGRRWTDLHSAVAILKVGVDRDDSTQIRAYRGRKVAVNGSMVTSQ
jgi:hypothetical protein